ncbi:unnamed protein product [Durusdinium trenchii]|uniref:Uncharacterized protein n=2 Tax=Durusdinium trenchii TaxID=1381693 RepID=A0ABP0SCL2_9DINO
MTALHRSRSLTLLLKSSEYSMLDTFLLTGFVCGPLLPLYQPELPQAFWYGCCI